MNKSSDNEKESPGVLLTSNILNESLRRGQMKVDAFVVELFYDDNLCTPMPRFAFIVKRIHDAKRVAGYNT